MWWIVAARPCESKPRLHEETSDGSHVEWVAHLYVRSAHAAYRSVNEAALLDSLDKTPEIIVLHGKDARLLKLSEQSGCACCSQVMLGEIGVAKGGGVGWRKRIIIECGEEDCTQLC